MALVLLVVVSGKREEPLPCKWLRMQERMLLDLEVLVKQAISKVAWSEPVCVTSSSPGVLHNQPRA